MSAPASLGDRVAAQARFETGTLLRNGEQLLVTLILPALALVALSRTATPDLGTGRRINVVTAGVLALSVASTAFTGQAISTAFDRRYGVLRWLGASPLGRGGLLLGKALAVLAILAVQLLVLGGLAAALGWEPSAAGVVPGLISVVLGAACFVSIALLLAGAVRAEAVLAIANLLWVLFLGLGLLMPTSVLPAVLQPLAVTLPSGALGDAMRASLVSGHWPLSQWAVLVAWGVGASAVTSRLFRWTS
jgi:ABC-2 type transport system permease protein